MSKYSIGVDFGTDSVRTIIVDVTDGQEIANAVFAYPRWRDQLFCDRSKSQFRQHPLDYIEGLEQTVTSCLKKAGDVVRRNIVAISMGTTGSTPAAVDKQGRPLALDPEFSSDPDAMFWLWKDHTSVREAMEINAHAKSFDINYLQYAGGIYSSEWFWAKLLHVLRSNPKIRSACYSWVEHSDWMPFMLTGGTQASAIRRNVCAAGHKALWAEAYGGLPPEAFFEALDPLLPHHARRFAKQVYTADQPAGRLSKEWAQRLSLSDNVLVGIGVIDAHVGAVGGQITPYHLSKVMGTSTCDMLVIPPDKMEGKLVNGICGQVHGSIIPGLIGLEAGQSAFGDTYAWFKELLLWPMKMSSSDLGVAVDQETETRYDRLNERLLDELGKQAKKLPVSIDSEFAIDWFNGRRTPDANPFLSGSISGLTLGSTAPHLYRALVESTCFGARSIVDRFATENIPIEGIIGVGGIARRSTFVMQMMADILDMPIRIHESEQTCALGAAMFAATVAGCFPNVQEAMETMGKGFEKEYRPGKETRHIYDIKYQKYKAIGNFYENSRFS